MAAESFWNYAVDPRQQQAAAAAAAATHMWQQQQQQAQMQAQQQAQQQAQMQAQQQAQMQTQQQQAGHHHAAAAAAAPSAPASAPAPGMAAQPPLPAGAPPQRKRQRQDYYDMSSGQGGSGFNEAMGASYGHHLNSGMPYVGASQTAGPFGGMAAYTVGNHQMMGLMGLHSAAMGSAWTNPVLPPDASSTLYVDGLPTNCTKREVSHIFRPFAGFCEVRLVNKESRTPGRYHVLCFVDFNTPAQAFVALDTLQGYKFDEHDSRSSNLRLEFSSSPGPRSGGGASGRY